MYDSLEKRRKYAREWAKKWRAENPRKAQDAELRRNHNISLEDYEGVFAEQGGVCAICKQPPGTTGTGNKSKGTLAVDHCHNTGVFRGLLCTNCNLGLGSFFESPNLLRAAADYLQRHQELVEHLLEKKRQLMQKQVAFVDAALEELANGP